MKKNKFVCSGVFLLLAFSIFSCSSLAELKVMENGDVVVSLSIQPSKNTSVLVENMAGSVDSIFDAKQLSTNLKTEDVETLNFKTESNAAISGEFKIPQSRIEKSDLFEIDLQNKIISCNISKENLVPLIKTFPQDIKDYLELFVSPIMSGENLTASEYENLILSVYGPNISNELKTSFFKIVLSCPGVIVSVKSEPEGRVRYFAGNSATLTIPLSYMLSLEKPLHINVNYK